VSKLDKLMEIKDVQLKNMRLVLFNDDVLSFEKSNDNKEWQFKNIASIVSTDEVSKLFIFIDFKLMHP
jgi:hypothetical protein